MLKYLQTAKITFLASTLILFLVFSYSSAEEPTIQTPKPVIHLADNLDEKDNLGWCIDTVGRGFAERLHAHSCKPRGGDVQFSYNIETLNILSVPYENKCVTIENTIQTTDESKSTDSDSIDPTNNTELMLLDCVADDVSQHFIYDTETLSFHPQNNLELCLSVGDVSRSAGPYMSRNLQLDICSETDASFWQWVILKDDN